MVDTSKIGSALGVKATHLVKAGFVLSEKNQYGQTCIAPPGREQPAPPPPGGCWKPGKLVGKGQGGGDDSIKSGGDTEWGHRGWVPVPACRNPTLFRDQRSLSQRAMDRLFERPVEQQHEAMATSTPREDSKDTTGKFTAFLSAKFGKGHGKRPRQESLPSSADANDFAQRWGLDDQAVQFLLELPGDSQREVMQAFKPDDNTRDVSRLFISFAKSLRGAHDEAPSPKASVQEAAPTAVAEVAADTQADLAAEKTDPSCEIGDIVEYDSSTHTAWIRTKVREKNKAGDITLLCKKGVLLNEENQKALIRPLLAKPPTPRLGAPAAQQAKPHEAEPARQSIMEVAEPMPGRAWADYQEDDDEGSHLEWESTSWGEEVPSRHKSNKERHAKWKVKGEPN